MCQSERCRTSSVAWWSSYSVTYTTVSAAGVEDYGLRDLQLMLTRTRRFAYNGSSHEPGWPKFESTANIDDHEDCKVHAAIATVLTATAETVHAGGP